MNELCAEKIRKEERMDEWEDELSKSEDYK